MLYNQQVRYKGIRSVEFSYVCPKHHLDPEMGSSPNMKVLTEYSLIHLLLLININISHNKFWLCSSREINYDIKYQQVWSVISNFGPTILSFVLFYQYRASIVSIINSWQLLFICCEIILHAVWQKNYCRWIIELK